ncbi:MAG: hypothetical protein ACREEB_12575 [Caulobacteraceae bacterium]
MFPVPLVIALGVSLLGGRHPGAAVPSLDDIDFIERKVNLPSDAPGPLSSYERYYAWTIDNGKKYIYAEYIYIKLLGPKAPDVGSRHIHAVAEDDIPAVSNGGCGVITFYFDPRGDRTPSLYCNAMSHGATP